MYTSHHDNLYREPTLFDLAFAALAQRLQVWLPAGSEQRWMLAFRGQAVVFALLGLGVLLHGLQSGTAGAQLAAVLGSAGLMATAHFLFNITRRPAAVSAQPAPAVAVSPAPAQSAAPQARPQPRVSPRVFLNELREAGVNVRIARALYTAGVRSPDLVRNSADETLLAIRGVGPVTLRRLRETFGEVRSG